MGDRGIQGPKGMDGPMVSHSRLIINDITMNFFGISFGS